MPANIYMDTSEVQALAGRMARSLTEREFDKRMRKALRETGKQTVTESRKEINSKYYGGSAWIRSAIKKPKISGGGSYITCTIPIENKKGSVGGTFAASGGWFGWNPPAYRIQARIVKGETTTLPPVIPKMGGQPPFRNMGGGGKRFIGKRSKLSKKTLDKMKFSHVANGGAHTLVFTRKQPEENPFYTKSKERVTYRSVKGLAVAQMAMTRARSGIEQGIEKNVRENVVSNFSNLFV